MTWAALATDAPELAQLAEERLLAPGLAMLGTLRADGRPRISAVNPLLLDGRLYLGMYLRSTKALDLRRDGRCTLHQCVGDAFPGPGELKLYAHAHEIDDREEERRYLDGILHRYGWRPPEGNHVFELALEEVAIVRLKHDAVGTPEIVRWTPGAPAVTTCRPRT